MFIRQYFKQENGRRTAYWALVESHRTATGPRQRVVAWLGKLDEAGRLGVKRAAEDARRDPTSVSTDNNTQPLNRQKRFEFDDDMSAAEPRWVEVNAGGVRVENLKKFGGPWLALHLIRTLQLESFLSPLRIKRKLQSATRLHVDISRNPVECPHWSGSRVALVISLTPNACEIASHNF